MKSKEKNAYILGTEREELKRLGLQHQVWASEARNAWEYAEFTSGQTILDLGCGPGFCSRDLAYIAGNDGLIIAVDKSEAYTRFLRYVSELHDLNIEVVNTDFNNMELSVFLDGMYCRWALAWIPNPEEILQKVYKALKPGGVMIIQEYYDWGLFQTEPKLKDLEIGIKAALQSLLDSPGEINIGKRIPATLEEMGMEVIRVRPMNKLALADELTWQWPKTFLEIYLPKLTDSGYLNATQVQLALDELYELEYMSGASILCPQMVEVIAVKP